MKNPIGPFFGWLLAAQVVLCVVVLLLPLLRRLSAAL
jgi:hypothetical protein